MTRGEFVKLIARKGDPVLIRDLIRNRVISAVYAGKSVFAEEAHVWLPQTKQSQVYRARYDDIISVNVPDVPFTPAVKS